MTKVFAHISRRFNYLRQEIPTNWNVDENFTVPKTMLWETEKAQVFWEYHDGIIDEVDCESVQKLYLCLQNRDKNKKMFYVKPNFSKKTCQAFEKIAQNENIKILTCPKWSSYDFTILTCKLYEDRKRIRQEHQKHIKNDIMFFGSDTPYHFNVNKIWCEKLGCYITSDDAYLFDIVTPISNEIINDRKIILKIAQNLWGNKFSSISGLHPADYVKHLRGQRTPTPAICFQPHGVGLRHAIYECMMVGIPNIIPENSYLDNHIRSCNIIFKDLNELSSISIERNKDLEDLCIETFETYMTPEAIISNVITQLKQYDIGF